MKKYYVDHQGEGAPVTLIRREFGVDTKLAVFYPEVGYDLSRAISNLIAAALDTGRKDIFLLQIPTSQGREFDLRIVADRISTVDGTEIDVSFYRKGERGEDCIARVLAGVSAVGAPRVRIKSAGSNGGKRYLEVSLAGNDEKPESAEATPTAEIKPLEEKLAEKPVETPVAMPSGG